jgi:hypothetical protein
VFWSRHSDSHEDIIAEHKLKEVGARGIQLLRVEIKPADGDLSQPVDRWVYQVDQDMLPKWADAKRDEARTRAALADWYSAKVFTEGQHTVKDGQRYAIDSARVVARDSARVVARDSARVEAWTSARVEAWDSARVVAWGSARVEARDSARVEARDSARVEAWDSARVEARDSARVDKLKLHATARLYDQAESVKPEGPFAVLIDCRGARAVCTTGGE